MSRPLRIQYPGAWYHVMNRARRGQGLFPDVADMGIFLDIEKDIPQSKTPAPNKRRIIKNGYDFYAVVDKELIAMRRGVRNEPRDVAIYLLRTVCGEPLMRIGHEFGMTRYSSVSSAVDRIRKKRQKSRSFRKRVADLTEWAMEGQKET